MSEAQTDAQLLAASRSNPHWFVGIFDRHFAPIHRYAARRVGPELADELAAETFVQAFERRRFYDVRRPDARPWLYGIAANLLRQHRRTERRQLRAYARHGVEPPVDHESDAVSRADAGDQGRRLAAALADLPARDRDVLLLYAWADLTYDEIGLALDVPVGTVRSRLNRARRRVRVSLQAHEDNATERPQQAAEEVLPWTS